jgi:hypothetical protein
MSKEHQAAEESRGFDLSDLDAVDESEMTVMAGGRATDWVWRFAGPAHPKTIDQSNRISRERLSIEKQQEQARVNGKKWKAPDENPDEVRDRNAMFVVERLLGWSAVTFNGEDFPFSVENAKKLLTDRRKASLLIQALEFLGDENAFTKRSATN